jgi:hypothetical protein
LSSCLSKNIKIQIYKTIILPVLYVCENWSLALKKEHVLRVSKNRVPREEVAGGWRRLHNEE